MAKGRIKKGTTYKYPTGEYVREKIGDKPADAIGYRVVPVPGRPGRKILIALTRKRGPRGGRSKAVAILRRVGTTKKRAKKVKRRR